MACDLILDLLWVVGKIFSFYHGTCTMVCRSGNVVYHIYALHVAQYCTVQLEAVAPEFKKNEK